MRIFYRNSFLDTKHVTILFYEFEQIGENESSQVSNSNSTTDQMDHSWLLKINESQPVDSKNSVHENEFSSLITQFPMDQSHQNDVDQPIKYTKIAPKVCPCLGITILCVLHLSHSHVILHFALLIARVFSFLGDQSSKSKERS